jgi:5-methylcytosine-specific restriction endonuclease McrA
VLTPRQIQYREYLKSDDWKKKRAKKNPQRCGVCASTENLDVHHIHYRNLLDVEMSDLRVLCRTCHSVFHELERSGKIHFKGESHLSRWETLKHAVKKARGLGTKNMFYQ